MTLPEVLTSHQTIYNSEPVKSFLCPSVIFFAGQKAQNRFLEFFTASIRNPNTRAAYFHAVKPFFDWVESKGLKLEAIRPFHVAAYVEQLMKIRSVPTVKQHMAAIRMLFDYFVINQIIEMNPASAVRSPAYSAKRGKTPVLEEAEARQMITSIDTSSLVGLRDRALIAILIAIMVYGFARVGAVVSMKVEDYYPLGKRWWFRLHEKGG